MHLAATVCLTVPHCGGCGEKARGRTPCPRTGATTHSILALEGGPVCKLPYYRHGQPTAGVALPLACTRHGGGSRRAFHFQRQVAVIRGDSNPSVTTPNRLGDSFQFPLLFHEHVMINNFGLAYGVAGPESTVTSLMRRRAAPAPGLLAPHDGTREPNCDDVLNTDATHCEDTQISRLTTGARTRPGPQS